MASDLTFRISAVDNATATANKIQGSFAKISTPLTKLTHRLVDTGRRGVTALAKIETGLRTIAQTARRASDRIASIVPGMAALTGLIGGGAGIGALAEHWGNLGFHLQTTSRVLGMSAQSLQAWHFAAQRAGVSAQQFDQSVMSSQNTIRAAAFGGNPQAMMLLNRLGVSVSHQKNGDIDYQRTQSDIMRALARVRNPAGQRTAAEELGMGSILPMIQRGTYNADRQRAILDGYAPDNNMIARAAAFRDRINDLRLSTSALANTIGENLVPVLQPMVGRFTRWLNDHRVDIADRLADAVKRFTDWITSVNWGSLFDKVNKLADVFGGWGSVLRDLVAIKLGATVLSWTSSLVSLAVSLTAAKTAATALKVATGGSAAAAGGAAAGGAAAAGAVAGRYMDKSFLGRFFGLRSLGLGAGLMLYSSTLNTGEDKELAILRHGAGKHYLTAAQALPGGTRDPKTIAAVNRFVAMGWTPQQAAGIVANLTQESHLNPYALGDNGSAYGIGQWHFDRQADFKRVFGHDIRDSTVEEQEKFVNWELRHGRGLERDAGERLKSDTNAAQAGADVSRYYERPAATQQQMVERGNLSEQVLAAWQKVSGGAQSAPTQIHINVSAPPGTHVEARSDDGAGMPTRVNYQMLGALP